MGDSDDESYVTPDLDTLANKIEQGEARVRSLERKEAEAGKDPLAYYDRMSRAVAAGVTHLERLATLCGVTLDRIAEARDERVTVSAEVVNADDPWPGVLAEVEEAHAEYKQLYSNIKLELKRRAIVQCLDLMFQRNPWLDAVVLQEVNSFDGLQRRIWQAQHAGKLAGIQLFRGPSMSGGQRESYPMLLRTQREDGTRLTVDEDKPFFWLNVKGVESTSGRVRWNKRTGTYRPIVVHVVKVGGEKVHVGVVHTTPGRLADQSPDKEFQRANEYAQLVNSLKAIATRAKEGEWWVVGGDYYLSGESIVIDHTRAKLYVPTILRRLEARNYRWLAKARRLPLVKKVLENRKVPVKSARAQLISFLIEKEKGQTIFKDLLLDVTGIQTVRHIIGLSLKHNLPDGLALACAVSGTNWYDPKLLFRDIPAPDPTPDDARRPNRARAAHYATARVADIFVYGPAPKDGENRPAWNDHVIGILHPDGKVVLADTEDDLSCSAFWALLGDHFPAGAYFSSQRDDALLDAAVRIEAEAADAMRWVERYRKAFRLAFMNLHLKEQPLQAPLRELHEELLKFDTGTADELEEWNDWIGLVMSVVQLRRDGSRKITDTAYESYKGSRPKDSPRIWHDDAYAAGAFNDRSRDQYWEALGRRLALQQDWMAKNGILGGNELSELAEVSPRDYGPEGPTLEALLASSAPPKSEGIQEAEKEKEVQRDEEETPGNLLLQMLLGAVEKQEGAQEDDELLQAMQASIEEGQGPGETLWQLLGSDIVPAQQRLDMELEFPL